MNDYLRPLGEVCEINPRLGNRAAMPVDLEVSFVPMAAVDEHSGSIVASEVRRFAECARGYTAFAEGDVLFAKITPCMENGKVALAQGLRNGLGFGSTEFHVLRPGPSVLPKFVFHYVRQQSFRALAQANFTGTAGQQRVPTDFLRRVTLPVPALDRQRRIVDLLDRAAGLKRLAEEAQAKVRELIPALFADMFGDPATNPKELPVVPLGETFDAADYGTSVKANDSTGVPVLRMGNVSTSGELLLSDLKFVELPEDQLDRQRLRPGDILFNRTNSKELVGKTGLWDGRFEAVAASYFIRVRIRSELAHPTYVWAFLNSRHMKQRLYETARGAIGQANINGRELRAFDLPLPPVAHQQDFARRAEEITAIRRLAEQAAAAAERTSAALMSRLFAG